MSARPATQAVADADAVDGLSFDELRAHGLTLLQSLSGRVWTDHNLHDPGITLLEQLCFGLTDIVYRAGFPVADHLTGPDGRIDHADQSLHPPSEALPCRPTTPGDYRRHLLDALPELDDAMLEPDPGTGLYRLRLKFRPGLGTPAQAGIAAAWAAWLARRNLGEDLDPDIVCLREVPCDLHADIEIGGPRDAADILAEVYDRCARYIANAPRSRTLDELRREGRSLEDIYTGPAVQHGFIDDDRRFASGGALRTLTLSELAGLVREVPGVQDARLLALQLKGQETTAGSVVWRDRDSALALRLPDHDVPATITVRRRGHVVPVAWQDLRRRLGDLQAGGRTQRARTDQQQAGRANSLMPQGLHRAMQGYASVQDHLPALYGLGRHGPGPSAPPQRQAEVKQLKAYLVMQEQAIAQALAQLAHLRELFSVAPDARQGLWTQMIGPDTVPGVDQLYLQPLAQVADAVYKPFDSGYARKHRALDHLLALHGETYTQNSMRQFFGHYKPREAERLLLENKATWLRGIVPLTRDRASGFDPCRESWNRRDNCSGMQRRASLLLGFKHWHDRPLTQVLSEERLQPVRRPDERHQSWQLQPHDPDLARALAVGSAARPVDMRQLREDLQRLPWLREPLPGGLWRAAQHEGRYRLLDGADGASLLVLGPDENGRWWRLGSFRDAATARRTAAGLRLYLRGVDQASEGLHLVEHVLLRPLHRDTSRHDALALVPGFHRLAVTAVLPNWTQRTAGVAFRRFACETLRLSCPAHLTLYHLPLDAARMQAFEAIYAAWLEARRAWCQRPTDEVLQWTADGHACELITLMRSAHRALAKAWTRTGENGDETPALQGHA